jgi:hypothetical protein
MSGHPVPLPRPYREIRSFFKNGEVTLLGNPDGRPTGRQLLALWHAGALALVLPDPWNQFSKAQAAGAIDCVRSDDA